MVAAIVQASWIPTTGQRAAPTAKLAEHGVRDRLRALGDKLDVLPSDETIGAALGGLSLRHAPPAVWASAARSRSPGPAIRNAFGQPRASHARFGNWHRRVGVAHSPPMGDVDDQPGMVIGAVQGECPEG